MSVVTTEQRFLIRKKNGFRLSLGAVLKKKILVLSEKNVQYEFVHKWQLYMCVHVSF